MYCRSNTLSIVGKQPESIISGYLSLYMKIMTNKDKHSKDKFYLFITFFSLFTTLFSLFTTFFYLVVTQHERRLEIFKQICMFFSGHFPSGKREDDPAYWKKDESVFGRRYHVDWYTGRLVDEFTCLSYLAVSPFCHVMS